MKALACGLIILLSVVVAESQQTSQLTGYVTYKNKTPAKRVVMSVGGYSVVTDGNGFYKFDFLKPGSITVSIAPPGKRTRSFKVSISRSINISILSKPATKHFVIDW